MLDSKDLEILEVLQKNAKWTTSKISKKTLIPVTTVHNRIKKMESMGIIRGYTALLDHKKLGNAISAFVFTSIKGENPMKRGNEILQELNSFSEVHETYSVTGEHDIVLKVMVKDTDELHKFIERLNGIEGIEKARTSIILKSG